MEKQVNRWRYAFVGVIIMLLAGQTYSWSVMVKSIQASRPWSTAELSLTFTIVMISFCLGALAAGILSKKIKVSLFIKISGCLYIAGYMIASLTGASPILLYIGFGAICGVGAGFAYNAVLNTVLAWFPDKQGLLSGILLMGFGISSFIVGKLFAAFTPADGSNGWQTTFRAMGIIIFVGMFISSFFIRKPPADYTVPGFTGSNAKASAASLDFEPTQMLKMPPFWNYYIYAITGGVAGLAIVSQSSGIATEVNSALSSGTIATVVGIISISNGLSRILFGILYDKKGFRLTMLGVMITYISAAVLLLIAIRTGSFALLVIGSVLGGMGYGGVTPVNSAIIREFFGTKNYATNFAINNSNLIIASFSSTVAGRLFDISGSYVSTMYMIIIVAILGILLSLIIRKPTEIKA